MAKRQARAWVEHNWQKEVFFTAAYTPYNTGPFIMIRGKDGAVFYGTAKAGSKQYYELLETARNFRNQFRECSNT